MVGTRLTFLLHSHRTHGYGGWNYDTKREQVGGVGYEKVTTFWKDRDSSIKSKTS